jgi:hypothetical protein
MIQTRERLLIGHKNAFPETRIHVISKAPAPAPASIVIPSTPGRYSFSYSAVCEPHSSNILERR